VNIDKILDGIEAALAGRTMAQLTEDEKKTVATWRPPEENPTCGDYAYCAHSLIAIIDRLTCSM